MMEISTRQRDGITILDLEGKVTVGRGDVALRETVCAALANGSVDLVINFTRVERMDSSGLGELVAASERAKAEGGRLKLTNLPANIEELLTVTALMSMLEVFEDEDSALDSFGRTATTVS